MYKNLIFPILLAFSCLSASAQRYTDFSITLIEPLTTDTVYTDMLFNIKASIKNNGLDTFFTQDSLAFELFFDGSPVSFSNGTSSIPYIVLTNEKLLPGDNSVVSFTFGMKKGSKTGPMDMCVGVSMLNTVDTMLDTVSANNQNCASIMVLDQPTSVNDLKSKTQAVNVYPNPATCVANFEVGITEPADVMVLLTDVTGRLVKKESRYLSAKGTLSINMAELPKGMYLYIVQAGQKQVRGKLEVQ